MRRLFCIEFVATASTSTSNCNIATFQLAQDPTESL